MKEEELEEKMKKDLDEVFNVEKIMDFQFDLSQKAYSKGLETGLLIGRPIEGTEKESYEFVKKEMEKPYDYRSVIYAIEHIILAFEKDISPNLRKKLNHWKRNIQEELDKE